jgi:hypothetical protein
MSSQPVPRLWTDPERQALLDLLRAATSYRDVARALRRDEADCRAEAENLRAQGWAATGARQRTRLPPPSRRCLCCGAPFAPETRFMFMRPACRRQAEGIAA